MATMTARSAIRHLLVYSIALYTVYYARLEASHWFLPIIASGINWRFPLPTELDFHDLNRKMNGQTIFNRKAGTRDCVNVTARKETIGTRNSVDFKQLISA